MYSNYFIILYGTTQQWTQRIICKLDHLWYASGKIKRIECVKLIFKPGPKKRKEKRKKDSFDLFQWRTTDDPIYI